MQFVSRASIFVLTIALIMPFSGRAKAAVAGPPNTGAVSFTFDDAYLSALTKAAPVLASQGYSGTEYVPTGEVGIPGNLTWAQLTQLKNTYGWEMGAHTVSHVELPTKNNTQIISEITQSKTMLQSHGFTPTTFATPYGAYNNFVLATIAKYFPVHRGFFDIGQNIWPYNGLLIQMQQVQGGVSVATVKSYIDQAKKNHTWLVLVFHDIKDNASSNPDDYEYKTQDLQSIVNYVKAQGLPVMTVAQAIDSAEGTNLLSNSSFESGLNGGWTTDAPTKILLDAGSHGSYPAPKNSILLTGTTKNIHLFSPKVGVTSGTTYGIKSFLNVTKLNNGGEIGFFVDEYDGNGNWISGQYKIGEKSKFVEDIAFTYKPSSTNVKQASLQVIVVGNSNALAYLDNVRWFAAP